MEVVQLLEIRDYWSNAEIMNMSLFPSITSLNRFEMNSRYLYLSDNEVTPTYSPGYKLYEIGDIDKVLNSSFKRLCTPDQNLSVDEQIIAKARISFCSTCQKSQRNLA